MGAGFYPTRSPIPQLQPATAFTLIELLLAVLIFAMVLGAINSVFYAALRLRNKTAEVLDKSVPLQQALVIIKRDLASIVPPNGAMSGQLQSTPNGTNLMAGASGPIFYCATGILDETSPLSEIQKISYSLVQSTNWSQGRDLVRLVTRNVLSTSGEAPVQQRLLEGVEAITFSYYDGLTWRDAWDSTTEETPLPKAIKLDLQLAAERTNRMIFQKAPVELVVPILVQGRTNATSEGSSQ